MELTFGLVLFGFFLEDGVPAVNLVECLVKQVLLRLAIDTVLFRNLVLVFSLVRSECLEAGRERCRPWVLLSFAYLLGLNVKNYPV